MRTADTVEIRPGPVWGLAAIAWVALPFTFGPGLEGSDGWPRALVTVCEVLLGILWLTGVVAWVIPRPVHLVTLRLGGLLLLEGGLAILVLGSAPVLARAGAAAAAAYTFALCLTASVGDRMVDGASYPGERRFAFRAPLEAAPGIAVACLVPSACLCALLLALAAESPALRWSAAGVAALLVPAAWFTSRQLNMLGKRCLVFAPRAMAIVDPYLLSDPIAVPLPRIVDVSPARGGAADTVLDLRAGARGQWVQVLWDQEVDVPGPRRLPANVSRARPVLASRAIGVAAPLSTARIFVRVCAEMELPTEGSLLDAP